MSILPGNWEDYRPELGEACEDSAMNKDIRLSTSYFENPKIRKLNHRLGSEGVIGHLSLLCWTARVKPKGILKDMDEIDIEEAVFWKGEAGHLVKTLCELRLLDRDEGHYRIHDWDDHNTYACHAEERSEKARKAAQKRWEGQCSGNTVSNAQCSAEHSSEHRVAMLESNRADAPSPSPTPTPSPIRPLRTNRPCSISADAPCESASSVVVCTEESFQELWALIPNHERLPSTEKKLRAQLLEKGFDYVHRNILYTNAKAENSYQAYLGRALERDWGAGLEQSKWPRQSAAVQARKEAEEKMRQERDEADRRFNEAAERYKSLPESDRQALLDRVVEENPLLRSSGEEFKELVAICLFMESENSSQPGGSRHVSQSSAQDR